MLELGMGRDSCVIALGGGVTGDLAGFTAATFMRGVPFVQVPTTLLAMIDASIGGKTGVDTPAGKNLIGAFHSPWLVLSDPDVLRTLPAAQMRAGLAEAVKHGAILDAEYFRWIADHIDDILAYDDATLERLVMRSIELKAEIVAEDPLEAGRRAILNFGHTVGHALERIHDYEIAHGAAVAAGMCIEAALGEAAGITKRGAAAALTDVVQRIGLPTGTSASPDELVHAMRTDKKAREAQLRFVLLREIGAVAADASGRWTHAVDIRLLSDALHGTAPPGAV
jgi:3-dehydroquinate synthase